MRKNIRAFIAVSFLSYTVFLSGAVAATTVNTGDPNAEIRKLTSGGQDSALVEFERVKKLNNNASIAHFTSVLQKNPKDADAYAKRGKAYSGNKEYEKAQADFDKAIQLNPKIVDAYVGRAVVHLMKKEYDQSWEDVHKAEALGGQFWPAFMDALKKSSGRDK